MNSRRMAIAWGLLGVIPSLPAQDDVSDESFRYRWTAVDAVFQRARKARAARGISLADYAAVVGLLREEELAIFEEAGAHKFLDETESNYWHRSRLKFPSSLQAEVRLLGQGKDPALHRP